MNRYLLFIALSLIFGCKETNSVKKIGGGIVSKSDKQLSIPSLLKPKGEQREYIILAFSEKPDEIFKGAKATTLSAREIDDMYKLVQASVEDYNAGQKRKIDLDRYRLQLIPVITTQGEKVIWVNGFRSILHTSWQRRLAEANDEGDHYFRVSINLLRKKWYDFGVNGLA